MTPHVRKLLPPEPNIPSPSPSSSSKIDSRQNPPTNPTNNNATNPINPSFDSAMALTVLALLTALLFMSFLSIYIRHFSDSHSPSPRRRRSDPYFSSTASYYPSPSSNGKASGVGPGVIQSLPVHAYNSVGAKQGIKMECCAICLGEYEDGEWLKEIPYCGHVFHVECIETWLASHVTCPLCRTARLLRGEDEGSGDSEVQGDEVRLVVEQHDTWQGGEGLGVRRIRSCEGFGDRNRMTLHRSLSF